MLYVLQRYTYILLYFKYLLSFFKKTLQEILELKMDEMKQAFEKERQEMKAQIALHNLQNISRVESEEVLMLLINWHCYPYNKNIFISIFLFLSRFWKVLYKKSIPYKLFRNLFFYFTFYVVFFFPPLGFEDFLGFDIYIK